MHDILAENYLWVKAFHLIFVISWMAGLLYLPRLFVYHSGTKPRSEASDLFKVMERRLLRIIMNPAMVLSLVFGLALIATPGVVDWTDKWIHWKLTFVVLLFGYHGYCAKLRKAFGRDERPHSETFFRYFNELPALLMIGIVIFAVTKLL